MRIRNMNYTCYRGLTVNEKFIRELWGEKKLERKRTTPIEIPLDLIEQIKEFIYLRKQLAYENVDDFIIDACRQYLVTLINTLKWKFSPIY